MKAMSHMYRRAWRAGLKTTYYLRTLGASSIEKATVSTERSDAAPAAWAAAPAAISAVAAISCAIDAARNGEECEACQ